MVALNHLMLAAIPDDCERRKTKCTTNIQQPDCDKHYRDLYQRWYYVSKKEYSMSDAQTFCNEVGAQPAIISSTADYYAIMKLGEEG